VLAGIDPLPPDIARRPVAAHQHLVACSLGDGAADLAGLRPDDLGVMRYIAPAAGARDIGEMAGAEVALFLDEKPDRFPRRPLSLGPTPQVFALPLASFR
jgi:hypothetical protein